MPQLKIPATLYNAALSKTRVWIVSIASAIYRRSGNYENVLCQQAIIQFNLYLTSNIPTHIIDELYNSSEILFDSEDGNQSQLSPFEKHITFDQRIVLSLYIHKNMKRLTAHKIVNDNFWKSKLLCLQNLLRLDLNKVCTDEILEVVGQCCKNLEFVNIVSKSCHTRTKDRHNALKLQLCVSDTGLSYLSNCKQLKEIQMTCIIRKGCGGRQITNEGIKRLLLSLPSLRRINYTDTGILLDSITEVGKLSLISVTDYHPRADRIPKIEAMCPYLTELHLTYAFSSDDHRSYVISALSSSKLKISTLSLTNFPFDDCLIKYLELKGKYLREFNFISSFIQSVNELFRLLGWTCPNLENLHVHFHLFDRGFFSDQYPFNSSVCSNNKLFSNLKSLTIKGVYWDSSQVLPLLLKNAASIKKIVLNNHSYSGCLDELLQHIQQSNPFLHLESVSFLKGIHVSFQFLRTFLLACPMLRSVTVENESQAYFELVVQLREELLAKNVDVNIDVYGTC
uniref:Uncharacterized protein n=1 Tax=Cuerna arida TaxID=1464854 RepID=A0A1B6EMI1_9HEMI